MRILLVTGLPGSGKSTLCRLISRSTGLPACDADDGLCYRRYRGGNARVPDDVPTDWTTQDWVLDGELAGRWSLRPEPVGLLFGVFANEPEVWDLFDAAIFLDVPADDLRRRLLTRTGNDYGKNPDDLADVLRWAPVARAKYADLGAIVIPNASDVEATAERIVEIARTLPAARPP